MKKLLSARTHLLASPLGLRADKLLTFAEEGSVTRARGAGPGSFALTYKAHLIVTDYTGDPAALLYVLLEWLDDAMPGAGPDAVSFHVDILDHHRADVSLRVELVEVVRARTDATGTTLDEQDDPDAMTFDMSTIAPGLG